jgi:hypothetical protein
MIDGVTAAPDEVSKTAREIEAAIQRIVASIEVPRLKAP